jgi:hypothetical protein
VLPLIPGSKIITSETAMLRPSSMVARQSIPDNPPCQ